VVTGTELHPGRYGEIGCGVHLGNYADWIETTIAEGGVTWKTR
jgi:hypothetical protein